MDLNVERSALTNVGRVAAETIDSVPVQMNAENPMDDDVEMLAEEAAVDELDYDLIVVSTEDDGAWGVGVRGVPKPGEKWFLARAESRNHFWLVTLTDKTPRYQAIDREGVVFDETTCFRQWHLRHRIRRTRRVF